MLTSLALVVLALMAGLGVDVGYLRYQKQQMQKAADAGAIAGAAALIYGGGMERRGSGRCRCEWVCRRSPGDKGYC